MSSAINVSNLRYRPGSGFAIDNLSFAVPKGSIYGFLGANGSGKSTTIRTLMGMTRPDSGDVQVLGRSVPDQMPEILARVGYVPERPHLYRRLTVAQSLKIHAGFFPSWDALEAMRLVERFGLNLSLPIQRLSKGEVGKLMVLQALAQRPELLILDEPTDGLDPVVRRDLYEAILEYVADGDVTVFVSSHLVHELERICDRIAILDHGCLVEEGPIEVFKGGIRRLRISGVGAPPAGLPFRILRRDQETMGRGEDWLVMGWDDEMSHVFDASDLELTAITAFDLETGFVELLRANRLEAHPTNEAKDLTHV